MFFEKQGQCYIEFEDNFSEINHPIEREESRREIHTALLESFRYSHSAPDSLRCVFLLHQSFR